MDEAALWADLLAAVRDHQHHGTAPAPQDTLVLSLRTAARSIPGTAGCSVTQLQDDGTFVTPVTSGDLAMALDLAQYEAGDGPCMTAARTGERQWIDDMTRDGRRWAEFSQRATEHGVASSFSVPLRPGAFAGAINFYGVDGILYRSPHNRQVAELAGRITGALFASPGQTPAEPDGPGQFAAGAWDRALADRALITRARDVVAEHYSMTPGMAFRHLAVRTSAERQPMTAIARQVVEGRGLTEGEPNG